MINSIRNALLAVAVATAGLLVSCGGGGGGGSAPATGTVQFSMTDAPACGFDAVNVTVVKVRVHKSASAEASDAGWTDVTLNPARKINLVTLTNGKLIDLGQAPLGVGHYTQIRLVLAPNTKETPLANSVILTGSTNEIALDTPSAVQTGIKLNHEFDVAANTLVAFTLDFNACKSVVTRGNGSYGLKPVVRVIPVIVSGAIDGFIAPTSAAHPLVSAQLNGVEIKSTIPDPTTGAFSLSPLVQTAAGSGYTVVVTADNSATDVITNVPVVAQSTTILSTNTAPITLAASSTRTASGTVLPVTAQASVRAIQTYGSGSNAVSAEIKFTNADLANGTYSLTLPTTAAMLGTFGALPITFASQSASAAMYSIEASALGFTTQSVSADLSSANFMHDFTLN